MQRSILWSLGLGTSLIASSLFAQTVPRPVPRPSNPANHPAVSPQRRFNLNGTWKSAGNSQVKVQFLQTGDSLKVILVKANAQVVMYEGRYLGSQIVGRIMASVPAAGRPATWEEQTAFVDDPDHVRFAGADTFVRVSQPRRDDAGCDFQNSSRTKPEFALLRGVDADTVKDYKTAACWFYVGAVQGNARAQASLASVLDSGTGVRQDYRQAFLWAQKSAAQGDVMGEIVLEKMYRRGEGTPVNVQMANSLHAREDQQLAQLNTTPRQRSPQQTAQNNRPQPNAQQMQDAETLKKWMIFLGGLAAAANASEAPGGSNASQGLDDQVNSNLEQRRQDAEQQRKDDCSSGGGSWEAGSMSGGSCN